MGMQAGPNGKTIPVPVEQLRRVADLAAMIRRHGDKTAYTEGFAKEIENIVEAIDPPPDPLDEIRRLGT
jgi:hypothetical protein